MRVALYLRISEDTAGLALGVRRQEEDCRTLAVRSGWEAVYVAADNDVSAYKRKPRPQFERVLADLATGAIDGVVVYDYDRLARQPRDLERLIELYELRPLCFATVTQEADLSTTDGRFVARLMVNVANKASADTARRVRRAHLQLAMRGVPVGGHRPFGYEADKVTVRASEAALIRQAAADVLSGVGQHTICRRWNEAGVTTTAGNPWQKSVLRVMLLSPRMAGFRVYQGGIARHPDGSPVTGLFEPILDVDTWEAVCAFLRSRPSRNAHIGGRKYLLSGIIRCGLCGTTLTGSANAKLATFYYSCPSVTNGGCGKVGTTGPHVDALVVKAVLERYLSERELPSDDLVWPLEDELADIGRRVAEMMDAYGRRVLSGATVIPTVEKLEAEAAALHAERAAWISEHTIRYLRPVNPVEKWDTLDTDQRRGAIEAVLRAVVINPPMLRGPRFDPARVELVWRKREGSPASVLQ